VRSIVRAFQDLRSSRFRAVVRRDFPLLGVVCLLVFGQIVGGCPGTTAVIAVTIALAGVGYGVWRRNERLVVGGFVFVVGVVTTLATLPRSMTLPADAVWRGEVEEAPRYPKTGAVLVTIRAVPERGEGAQEAPTRLFCTAIDLPWRNIAGIERGDLVLFRAVVTPLEVTADPFAFSNLLRRRGVGATCRITHATPVLGRARATSLRIRGVIEDRVERIVGDGERWGLLLAMSIGARDTLSIETERAFKATGLSHLLVVSGFQVTLVYYFVSGVTLAVLSRILWLFGWMPVGVVARSLGVAMSLVFVGVSGIDGSSLRAAFAAVFAVIARSLERGGGLLNGVIVSLLGVSLVWPGAVLEPGVELTYAALLGICLGRGIFAGCDGITRNIRTLLGVTLGVWLLSSIVSLAWFRTFSPIGLVLNPLLAPLLGFVGCHGVFAGVVAEASGLDPRGIVLRTVGELLVMGRDLVVAVARSGVVVPELSSTGAFGCALPLGIVSARLLHRQLNDRFAAPTASEIDHERDGVTESRLSGRDRSATLEA